MRGYADGSRRDRATVRARLPRGPLLALLGLFGLLAVLAATVGLGARGWLVGLGCGAGLAWLVARSMAGHGRSALGPADRVTMARAVLVCAVAALAADGSVDARATSLLVGLSAVAIALDGVDGRVARRTGTSSAFGARFDMEVDALLILILSVEVAGTAGWWVLALGLARYAFLAAGALLPWLRASPPPRRWAKVVAVVVAVVLVVAASGALPDPMTTGLLVVALVLLAESFGRTSWDLWRLHGGGPLPRAQLVTAAALLLVWVTLLLPGQPEALAPLSFLRIPLEGLVLVGIAFLLPARLARVAALAAGLVLSVLTLLRLLDLGFQVAFDAPFHLVYDAGAAGPAVGLLTDSIGRAGAWVVLAGVVLLVGALLALVPLAVARLTRLMAEHRTPATAAVAALCGIGVVLSVSGVRLGPAGSFVSTAAAETAAGQVSQARDDLRDQREFTEALEQPDPFSQLPGESLLGHLRGQDVLLVFVESYGRTAFGDPQVDSAVAAGDQRLAAAGFSARSGWLTSPTFGGRSWLAHSTLQTGLWVDNQRRHDRLMSDAHFTLSQAFGRAGWETVVVAPEVPGDWPEAETFYHYDQVLDQRNLGYAGPAFSWAAMPDQYALGALERLVLDVPGRAPVMAQLNLVSSHWPWAPLPRLVDWSQLGDGSIFDPMPAQGATPAGVSRDPSLVREAYSGSIAYSMDAVTTFLPRLTDRDLVVVLLGDHQPSSLVSGTGAGRDVPVSIIASDAAVTRQAADWGWTEGLRPGSGAPSWPMDAFRNRFLTTYSTTP